jgi:hypothetical protein
MFWSFQNFLITKNEVLDHILDSIEIPQETAKQSLPNYTAQKKFPPFLWCKYSRLISFFFYVFITVIIMKFLMFQCNEIS